MSVTQQLRLVVTHCSVAGCSSPPKHLGLCGKHYQYSWRHGHPEGRDTEVEALPISERDAAWLAAVLDCEGWIGTCGSKGRFFNRIGVGNTNPKLITRILELTKCGAVRHITPKSPRAKPQIHWQVSRRDDVRVILLTVLPHLILKNEQANLILALPPRHAHAHQHRVATHLKLKELNKKGPA